MMVLLQVKVLNPELLKPIGDERFVCHGGTNLTWAHIDGRILQSKSEELPCNQVCGVHAHFSIRVSYDLARGKICNGSSRMTDLCNMIAESCSPWP